MECYLFVSGVVSDQAAGARAQRTAVAFGGGVCLQRAFVEVAGREVGGAEGGTAGIGQACSRSGQAGGARAREAGTTWA